MTATAVSLTAAIMGGRSLAATVSFVGPPGLTADITQPSSWSTNALPAPGDIAEITNGGTGTITTGETYTGAEIDVSNPTDARFGMLLQDGGSLNITNWFVAGRFEPGEYDLSGGTLNKTGGGMFLILGGDGGQGIMRMSGTSTVTTSGGNFAVGDMDFGNTQSNAELFLQDSATITTSTEFYIGQSPGTVGYVDMTGGTITDSNWMSVGRQGGTGTLDLSAGTINKTGNNSTHFIVGDSNKNGLTGTGTINQTGGHLSSAGSDLWLGSVGNGTYNISGGTLTTQGLIIGQSAGGVGVLNLNGGVVASTAITHGPGTATINWNGGVIKPLASNANLFAGFTSAQINIQSGGAVFDTGGFDSSVAIALAGGGGFTLQGTAGSLTFSGANTYSGNTTVNGGTLIVGSTGTLGSGANVSLNGGVLAISSDAAVSAKTVNFNGGLLQFRNYSSSLAFNSIAKLKLGAASGAVSTLSGLISGSSSLTFSGPGVLNLTNPGNNYTGDTNVNGGVLAITSAGALPTATKISVATGAVFATAALSTTFTAGAVNLGGSSGAWTGKIDLSNNNLIVQNGSIATLTSQIKQGFNGGSWNNTGGIVSTAAATDLSILTALGVVQNSTNGLPTGPVLYGTFEGKPASASDVLVKYTYYGDADLNGVINGNDYSMIDGAYSSHVGSGWQFGDFNYDGVIDGSDYTLIDNAFNRQGAMISATSADLVAGPSAEVASSAAVPEPATFGLLSIGLLLGLRRRRDR